MDPGRWQKLSRIAGLAMELDPAGVSPFLDRACGEDQELRFQIERILEANAGFDSMLDTPTERDRTRKVTIGDAFHGAGPEAAATSDRESDSSWIPSELVQRAAHRLRLVAVLYAAGFLSAYLVYEVMVHVVADKPYHQQVHTPGQVMTGVFSLLAACVALITRIQVLPHHRLLQLGLAFEVCGSLGIALVSYSGIWDQVEPVWGVSWLCVWILVFPMILSAPPRPAAVAAFASASTAPLAVLIWAATRDFAFPAHTLVLPSIVPTFVVAGLASLSARHVYRTGLELRAAKRLGRYQLVAPLGRGGMGEVWIAQHDLLARPAALKLIRPELVSAGARSTEMVARFEREAQSTAALSSPHTVRLYDFGLTADGMFYYVMELLDGLDLEALVRTTGPGPAARAVHFLRQACRSLAEAHGLGLVHRDIKPSNLFACRQGLEFDFIKVLDFGLVLPQQAESDGQVIIGTPAFMAPERWMGRTDAGADLFALGCVGYWLVTGHVPFDHPERMAAISRGPVRTPSSQTGFPLPVEFESAILACLESDPARRPQGVGGFDALLAQVPGPAWDQEMARVWWRDRTPASPSGPLRVPDHAQC